MGFPIRKGPLQRISISHLQSQLPINTYQCSWGLFWLHFMLWPNRGRKDFHNDWSSKWLQVQRCHSSLTFFSLSGDQLTIWAPDKSVDFLSLTIQWNSDRFAWLRQSRSTQHSIGSKRVCAREGTDKKKSWELRGCSANFVWRWE